MYMFGLKIFNFSLFSQNDIKHTLTHKIKASDILKPNKIKIPRENDIAGRRRKRKKEEEGIEKTNEKKS